MAKCRAGDCEVECGSGKGCGCIAESDYPENCSCYCFGDQPTKPLKLDGSTLVDVSLNELPLIEAARFLNQVQTESILVPTTRMSEEISRTINRKSVGDVLDELGLTTRERIERDKRRMSFLLFLAGFVLAAVLFGLVL